MFRSSHTAEKKHDYDYDSEEKKKKKKKGFSVFSSFSREPSLTTLNEPKKEKVSSPGFMAPTMSSQAQRKKYPGSPSSPTTPRSAPSHSNNPYGYHGRPVDLETRLRNSRIECEQLKAKVSASADECNRLNAQIHQVTELREICHSLESEMTNVRRRQKADDEYLQRIAHLEGDNILLKNQITGLDKQIQNFKGSLDGNEGVLDQLRRLEEDNRALASANDRQRVQYEKFVDHIAGQVVQAIIAQRSLRDECTQMRNRMLNLERQNQYLAHLFHTKVRSQPQLPVQAVPPRCVDAGNSTRSNSLVNGGSVPISLPLNQVTPTHLPPSPPDAYQPAASSGGQNRRAVRGGHEQEAVQIRRAHCDPSERSPNLRTQIQSPEYSSSGVAKRRDAATQDSFESSSDSDGAISDDSLTHLREHVLVPSHFPDGSNNSSHITKNDSAPDGVDSKEPESSTSSEKLLTPRYYKIDFTDKENDGSNVSTPVDHLSGHSTPMGNAGVPKSANDASRSSDLNVEVIRQKSGSLKSTAETRERSQVILGSRTLPLFRNKGQKEQHTPPTRVQVPSSTDQGQSRCSPEVLNNAVVAAPVITSNQSSSFSRDDGYSSMSCDGNVVSPISSRRELSTVGEQQVEDVQFSKSGQPMGASDGVTPTKNPRYLLTENPAAVMETSISSNISTISAVSASSLEMIASLNGATLEMNFEIASDTTSVNSTQDQHDELTDLNKTFEAAILLRSLSCQNDTFPTSFHEQPNVANGQELVTNSVERSELSLLGNSASVATGSPEMMYRDKKARYLTSTRKNERSCTTVASFDLETYLTKRHLASKLRLSCMESEDTYSDTELLTDKFNITSGTDTDSMSMGDDTESDTSLNLSNMEGPERCCDTPGHFSTASSRVSHAKTSIASSKGKPPMTARVSALVGQRSPQEEILIFPEEQLPESQVCNTYWPLDSQCVTSTVTILSSAPSNENSKLAEIPTAAQRQSPRKPGPPPIVIHRRRFTRRRSSNSRISPPSNLTPADDVQQDSSINNEVASSSSSEFDSQHPRWSGPQSKSRPRKSTPSQLSSGSNGNGSASRLPVIQSHRTSGSGEPSRSGQRQNPPLQGRLVKQVVENRASSSPPPIPPRTTSKPLMPGSGRRAIPRVNLTHQSSLDETRKPGPAVVLRSGRGASNGSRIPKKADVHLNPNSSSQQRRSLGPSWKSSGASRLTNNTTEILYDCVPVEANLIELLGPSDIDRYPQTGAPETMTKFQEEFMRLYRRDHLGLQPADDPLMQERIARLSNTVNEIEASLNTFDTDLTHSPYLQTHQSHPYYPYHQHHSHQPMPSSSSQHNHHEQSTTRSSSPSLSNSSRDLYIDDDIDSLPAISGLDDGGMHDFCDASGCYDDVCSTSGEVDTEEAQRFLEELEKFQLPPSSIKASSTERRRPDYLLS